MEDLIVSSEKHLRFRFWTTAISSHGTRQDKEMNMDNESEQLQEVDASPIWKGAVEKREHW